MALLLTIVLALATFMIGIAGNLVASELFEWMPKWAERLIRSAAAKVNEQDRERCLEEWLRSFEETPGGLKKLWDALTLRLWGAAEVNRNASDAASARHKWAQLTMALFEALIIVAAMCDGLYLRLGWKSFCELYRHDGRLLKAMLISFIVQFCVSYPHLYDNARLALDSRKQLVGIFIKGFGGTSFSLAAVFYWFPELMPDPAAFAICVVLAMVSLIGWRLGFGWMIRRIAG